MTSNVFLLLINLVYNDAAKGAKITRRNSQARGVRCEAKETSITFGNSLAHESRKRRSTRGNPNQQRVCVGNASQNGVDSSTQRRPHSQSKMASQKENA